MKAQPLKLTTTGYQPCDPHEADHLMFNMPGPIPTRIIPVMIGGRREGTPNWTWNGSVDSPTVKPSILSRGRDESGDIACHSYVNDGKVQFLSDCSHELSGQTVDLLDVEDLGWTPN